MSSGYSDFVVFELLAMVAVMFLGFPLVMLVSGIVNRYRHVKPPKTRTQHRPYPNRRLDEDQEDEEETDFAIFT